MKLPFWATSLTLLGIVILCMLGYWQLERLKWKTSLIQSYNAEISKDPLTFEITATNLSSVPKDKNFITGFAEGVYLNKKAIVIGPRTFNGKQGYHLITPFETINQEILLVNRGWIPINYKFGPYFEPTASRIISGIVKPQPSFNSFTPINDVQNDTWYRIDIEEIAAAKDMGKTLPFILYLNDPDIGTHEYPIAQALRWNPPNNHLSYAITWFSLAIVLFVLYVVRFKSSIKLVS